MADPSISSSYCFLIESSIELTEKRISEGYKDALEKQGHRVILFDADRYSDKALQHYIGTLTSQEIDYVLIFDHSPCANAYLNKIDSFTSEEITPSLLFIHYRNIWSNSQHNLFAAWQRMNDKSFHFCLEYGNFIDLRIMGLKQVYPIFHSSEFKRESISGRFAHDVSYVGSFALNISNVLEEYEQLPFSPQVAADFWQRLTALDKKIAPSAVSFASRNGAFGSPDFINVRSGYQHLLNQLSPCFRGELIKRIHSQFHISIFSDDVNSESTLSKRKNLSFYPSIKDGQTIREIYSSSRINLNITDLQFDDAIAQQVIDVASVGGFILTDWKADLSRLTSVGEAISYRTIEEFNQKIDYYLSHEKERLEIANQLHNDLANQFTYEKAVEFITSKLNDMSIRPASNESSPVYVDLGCDIHKPEGFIGVDIVPAAHVDVVADLNQRFPFPDSSVDIVRAYDLIEHLSDRIHTMNEIWRICKPDALVDIRVPSTDGRGAFQDPTHISFWNINSFRYYSIEFPVYLELCKRYGFQGQFSIIELKHEVDADDAIVHVLAKLKAIKSDDWLNESLRDRLRLKSTNLIIFPDWSQLNEDLHQALSDVIQALGSHPDRGQMTLLIDRGNFPESDEMSLETMLYELILNLMLTSGLDVANDGPEISLVEHLTWQEYAHLLRQISYRISLPQENTEMLSVEGIQELPTWDLTTLSH